MSGTTFGYRSVYCEHGHICTECLHSRDKAIIQESIQWAWDHELIAVNGIVLPLLLSDADAIIAAAEQEMS